jgi:hypothetical protein
MRNFLPLIGGCPGSVFQMESGADPRIKSHLYGIQIDVRSLCAPSRLELVKNVVVRNRCEEPGFGDSERLDQPDILRCGSDPSGRLDGSAGCITLLNGPKSIQVLFSIDEELGLTYCARSSGKPAEQVVDSQTLFGGQRQPSLLSVPMSCLGCPDFTWKAGGPLRPAIRQPRAGPISART